MWPTSKTSLRTPLLSGATVVQARGLKSRRSGFTIIEVLVSGSLLLFLLGALYLLMVGGMRYFQQGRAYQTVQNQTMIAMRRLLAELQDSRPGCWSFNNLPVSHLVFLSASLPMPNEGPVQHSPLGVVNWQKWVCYRLTAANELERQEFCPPAAPGLPNVMPPSTIPAYGSFIFAGPNLRIVARSISRFRVVQDVSPDTLRIEIQAREATGTNKFTEMELISRAYLQNRF